MHGAAGRSPGKRRGAFAGHSMVISEILSVSGAEGRTGAVTDVSPDPTEPAPTDLLDFPPLPQQPGRRGGAEPDYGYPAAGSAQAAEPLGDRGESGDTGAGGGAAGGEPDDGRLRVVSDAEATARLRIMLPTQPPTPSTALRPQASWEDTHAAQEPESVPFLQVAASPASPSTLPSQLAAMTTATMVIPLPPSVRPGAGLLTTTLPPDQAAQANAARIGGAFRDTIEEIFGVDFDTVDPAELGLPSRGAEEPDHLASTGISHEPGRHSSQYTQGTDFDELGRSTDEPADPYLPAPYEWPEFPAAPVPAETGLLLPRPVPAEVFGGAYGVPTQQAPFGAVAEPADPFGQNQRGQRGLSDPNRHALALRYLGGIFHDSSGESSYLDPEELDQGWIPSAFGAAPPDAPTEQLARIPALLPVPDIAPTELLPAVPPAEEPHGRSGSRGTRPPKPPTSSTTSTSSASSKSQGSDSAKPAKSPKTPKTSKSRRSGSAERAAEQAPAGSGGRGKALTVAGLCVAAFALLYGIALFVSGGVLSGTVPAGVSINGVSIGGLSPAAARAAISSQLGPDSTKPIALLVGQTPATLDPAKSGLTLDVAGTVEAAQSERTNPFTVIPALFGVHHDLEPVIDVDHTALNASLTTLATSYDTQMVEGKITFVNGQPVVTAPREGRGFDVAAAANAVASGYLRAPGPIVLPVNALTPLATPEALANALEQIARPAMSGPITVDTGGVDTVLTPTQLGDALTIAPNSSGTMVPTLDGTMLRTDLNPAALATEQPGVNASFTVTGGQPQLVPEKDGIGYSPQALAAAVTGVLTNTSARTVTVQKGPLPPAFTTADAQALDVQAVLGSATLQIPEATDRTVDTQHATSLVMGSVVQPGTVWSFDKTVGSPIAANGYTEPSGAVAGVDASGGNDLVATAVFDAAFRAGMGDTLHHPNAAYFSRYPVGLDAAVVWPGTDLQWTNTGSHPVYLYASYANGSLTVDLLGQPAYDQVNVTVSNQQNVVKPTGSAHYGCPAQAASNGFQVDVTRVLMRGGAQVGTEQFHVAYEPYAGTTCGAGSSQSSDTGTGTSNQPTSGTGSSAGGSPSSGSGGGGGGSTSSAPSQPAPSPTNSGVLGGLLH